MKQVKKWLVPVCIIIIISLLVGTGIFFGLPKIIENKLEAKDIKTLKEGYIENQEFKNDGKDIKDIQTNDSYTVILYKDGTVWIAGSNYYFNDGTIYGIERDKFTKLNLENIKQISVGSNFALALNENGEVYSWGGNDYGQLGRITSSIDDVPKKIDINNIKEIYVNNLMAAALSNDNNAYYWGYATDSKYDNKILKIENEKIDDIYLCNNQYFFYTKSNKLLGLGYQFDGVTNQQNGWAREPVEFNISNISKIEGCEKGELSSSYIILNDGTAYILDTLKSKELIKFENNQIIKNIFSFKYSSEECLIINENNDLYYNGKLLLKNVKDVKMPTYRDSFETILILKENGEIYSFGYTINRLSIQSDTGYSFNSSMNVMKLNIENIKLMSINKNSVILVNNNNLIFRQGKSVKGGLGIANGGIMEEFTDEGYIYIKDEKGNNITYKNNKPLENTNIPNNTNYSSSNDDINNKSNNVQTDNETNYMNDVNTEKPYYYELDNGEKILIDPNMSTMAD